MDGVESVENGATGDVPVKVPREAYAVLQARKKMTGLTIAAQLRNLIIGSTAAAKKEASP